MKALPWIVLALVVATLVVLATGRFDETAPAAPPDVPALAPPAELPQPAVEPEPEPEQEPESAATEAPAPRESVADQVDTEHRIEGAVRDERGEPVGRFRVTARFRPAEGERDWQERDLGEFGAGRFELTELEEGTWKLRASAAGHAPSRSKLMRVPNRKGSIELTLERRAVVAGFVVDPFGNGVAGAKVIDGAHFSAERHPTDDGGAFEIEVDPGAFELVAKGEVFAPSAPFMGSVEIGRRLEGVTLALRSGGRLTGEILDTAGGPRAGWWAEVESTDWRLARPKVRADETGLFAFEHLAPGSYMVHAKETEDERNGTTPLRDVVTLEAGATTHVVLGGVDENAITVRGLVTLRGEPAHENLVWSLNEGSESYSSGQVEYTDEEGRFEMQLPEPGPAMILVQIPLGEKSAKGTVTYHFDFGPAREHEVELEIPVGRIAGVVVGADGGPPERRKVVRLRPEAEDPITTQFKSRSTKTDDEGGFAFEFLSAGTYRVSMLSVVGPDSTAGGVRLGRDDERSDIVLRATETGDAVVSVVDAAGAPVRGASLYAHDENGTAYGVSNTVTAEEGTLKFRNLAPGNYRFFARKEGLASTGSGAVAVRADETAEVTVQLTDAALMRVSVEDESGQPVRAHLRVLDATGRDFAPMVDGVDFKRYLTEGYSSTTRRVGPLLPGTYRILARVEDGRTVEHELTLSAGADEPVRLKLGE
jgi:hypothetical protein